MNEPDPIAQGRAGVATFDQERDASQRQRRWEALSPGQKNSARAYRIVASRRAARQVCCRHLTVLPTARLIATSVLGWHALCALSGLLAACAHLIAQLQRDAGQREADLPRPLANWNDRPPHRSLR